MSGINTALGSRLSAAPARAVAESRGPRAEGEDTKLRDTARQMQGLFVEQLFKAMRETVPQDGAFSGGSGEEMFTGLMDSHLAAETPGQWDRGLGEAVYRQLRASLHGGDAASVPATTINVDTNSNAPAPAAGQDRR